MGLTHLKCLSCQAALDADDIDATLGVVTCEHCGSLFSLPGRPSSAHTPREPERKRREIHRPDDLDVMKTGTHLILAKRWRRAFGIWGVGIFALIWNAFTITWHGIAIHEGLWSMSAVGMVPTVIGIGLAHFVLACLLNTTTLQVSRGTILLHHGPVAWPGNKRVRVSDVAQVFCRRGRGPNDTVVYSVELILQSGERRKLVGGFDTGMDALYVEQEIERFLEIEDKPVNGEIRRA